MMCNTCSLNITGDLETQARKIEEKKHTAYPEFHHESESGSSEMQQIVQVQVMSCPVTFVVLGMSLHGTIRDVLCQY